MVTAIALVALASCGCQAFGAECVSEDTEALFLGLRTGTQEEVIRALERVGRDDRQLFQELGCVLDACRRFGHEDGNAGSGDNEWETDLSLESRTRAAFVLSWIASRLQHAFPCAQKIDAQRRFMEFLSGEESVLVCELPEEDRLRLIRGAVIGEENATPSFPFLELLEKTLPLASQADEKLRRTVLWHVVVVALAYAPNAEDVLATAEKEFSPEEMDVIRCEVFEAASPGWQISEEEYHRLRSASAEDLVDEFLSLEWPLSPQAETILIGHRRGDVDICRAFLARIGSTSGGFGLWMTILMFLEPPVLESAPLEKKELLSAILDHVEADIPLEKRDSLVSWVPLLEAALLGEGTDVRASTVTCGDFHYAEDRILKLFLECVTCPSAVAQMNAADALGRIVSKRPDLAEVIFRGLKEAREKRTGFPYQPFSDDPGWQNDLECNPEPEVLYRLEAAIRSAESAMERYKERDEPEAP